MQRSSSAFYMMAAGLLACLVVITLVVHSPMRASAESADAPPAIWLRAAKFVPALGQEPDIPASLRLDGRNLGASEIYLIQFNGPVQEAWTEQLRKLGVQFLAYVPDYAFEVRMSPAVAKEVIAQYQAGDHQLIYVGPYHPAYRLSPDLPATGRGIFEVALVPAASVNAVRAAVGLYGGTVLAFDERQAVIAADAKDLAKLALLPEVSWIQQRQEMVTHNDVAAGLMNASPAWSAGYTGQGQSLAVADTGLDTGNKSTVHLDFRGRVANLTSWPIQPDWNTAVDNPGANDGAADLASGHGTHVLGSAGGDGSRSNGLTKGIAPGATLNLQAVEQWVNYNAYYESQGFKDGYALAGLPTDLADLFNEAYQWGARVHTNSWGASKAGLYNSNSREADAFLWDHKDMTVLFSAGNDGVDSNRDGIVDPDSMGSPATAKNVITVGAVESTRTRPSPNANSGTYGSWWPNDFPVNPLKDDPMADAGDSGMVAFSSRGPTDDGRIKPDVVAPGTWILSVRSSRASSNGWGTAPNQYYMYMGGTSMATPLTAGAATVVREFYVKGMRHSNPSAALIKATLINTADDVPGQYAGSKNDAGPIPNNDEGWGAVNLGAAVNGAHRAFEDDPQAALRTGGERVSSYWVNSGGSPFKVSLVWTDYPGTESASKSLVNDLDLTVKAPNGTTYRGNVFSGGWSTTGGSPDRLNNVECVYIRSAAQGTYEITVRANNVPVGPQAYALVVSGNVSAACQDDPKSAIERPAENDAMRGVVTVSGWAADFSSSQGTGVTGVRILADGAQVGMATYGGWRQDIADAWGNRFGPSGYTYQWNTTAIADGQHTLQIQSQGACGWKTTSERVVVVRNQCNLALAVDRPTNGSTVSGQLVASGWAVHQNSASGTGVDAVGVWLDGPRGQGVQILNITQFQARPDIAALLGQQFLNSGYQGMWNSAGVGNGAHKLYFYAHSPSCGWSDAKVIDINIQNSPCDLRLAIDAPKAGSTLAGSVSVRGWALDLFSASGTGVDAVGVWLDGPRGQGMEILNITQFQARPDLASILGQQFLNSGYQGTWNSAGVGNGAHKLYLSAHSPSCGWSDAKVIDINIQNSRCDLRLAVDAPRAGSTLAGSVSVRGWALDLLSASGTGVDAVGVWLDGPRGQGVEILNITQFQARPDLASILGQQFLNSGYQGVWDSSGVGNGSHTLYVYAHSPTCGWSDPKQVSFQVQNVACDLRIGVDLPGSNATVSGLVDISGWAVDLRASGGAGVDKVGIWLDGPMGVGQLLFEITDFHARPDLVPVLGPARANCGWHRSWDTSSVVGGQHTLYISAHSPSCGWSQPVTRTTIVVNHGVDVRAALEWPAQHSQVSGRLDIRGWALDLRSASGSGVDAVGLWLDGPMNQGLHLQDITTFHERPDLAAALGEQFRQSGFRYAWNSAGVANGPHVLHVYFHSETGGWYGPLIRQFATLNSQILLAVDWPPNHGNVSGQVQVSGWAVDKSSNSGSGIEKVSIWLDGAKNVGDLVKQIWSFGPRPDIASLLGPSFLNCGYTYGWDTTKVSNGAHTLWVYAYSPQSGWSEAKQVSVVVNNADSSTIFWDDFGDASSGWDATDDSLVARQYMNGEYRVLVKDDYRAAFSAAPNVLCQDCGAEVDARFATDVHETLGILFGITSNWDTYLFEVSATGWYRLRIYKDRQWSTLLNWTASVDLNLEMGINHLRAVRSGDNIILYANGTRLITVQDTQLGGKLRVGLVATAGADTPVDARFDNFRVFTVGTTGVLAEPSPASEALVGAGSNVEEALDRD